MVKKLPSDFDIFSLSMLSRPLCIQTLAKRSAARRLALRDLVLVVGELQVLAAAVDVEGLAEQGLAHRRALDVPARPAEAVLARPLGVVGLARLRRLPHHEVERIFLAVEHRHPLAGAKLVDRLARELAVAGELAHRVVHVAARARGSRSPCSSSVAISSSICGTYCGGARLVRRPLDEEPVGVLVQRRDHLLGELADRDAALERALDDLVVDVGDVAHVGDAHSPGP